MLESLTPSHLRLRAWKEETAPAGCNARTPFISHNRVLTAQTRSNEVIASFPSPHLAFSPSLPPLQLRLDDIHLHPLLSSEALDRTSPGTLYWENFTKLSHPLRVISIERALPWVHPSQYLSLVACPSPPSRPHLAARRIDGTPFFSPPCT